MHASAKQVKVISWRSGVAHGHVVLGAKLQKAFKAGRRVLGPLAFVAVRKEHHKAVLGLPLVFGGADKLVNNDLRSVGKVAKLRLPNHERFRAGHSIAVIKSEHRIL